MEFSPDKGNVAFASAHDGWAFRVGQFADLYAAKLGFKASALTRALWGDYRIDSKTKRIMRIKASQAGKYRPLFVQVRIHIFSASCMHLAVQQYEFYYHPYGACVHPAVCTGAIMEGVRGVSARCRCQGHSGQNRQGPGPQAGLLRILTLTLSHCVPGAQINILISKLSLSCSHTAMTVLMGEE